MKTTLSATALGLLGLQRGTRQMREAASRIANAEYPPDFRPTRLAESLIDLQAGGRQARLSARVIQTEERLLGRLFDDYV